MRLKSKVLFALAVPILLGISQARALAAAPASYSITATVAAKPPAIDGTLNDPAWKSAAHVSLAWDFTFRRAAQDPTDAYVMVDSKYIYVAFAAKQSEAITATQHTNDQPMPNDDVVRVYLWPAGDNGNEYGFVANPIGTRYAFSSENTAFSPVWEAVAKQTADGYVVTERIPLNVMRGDGRTTWRVQFDRRIRTTNQVVEWAYDPSQGGTDSNVYAGFMTNMAVASHSARTKPRLAIYALGQAATPVSGGSTSRAGADLSLPITNSTSFVATFHPDYSNVELDQQSISPTAFPRRYSEVRPFFTQGSSYYNNFNCNDCLDYPLLYTPAIPTPRDGYAFEGKQGPFTFGSFDAVGVDRNDNAQSFVWHNPDRSIYTEYQRVGVDMPGFHDVAEYVQPVVGNVHNFNVYATLGKETGTQVTLPGQGNYDEYGLNLYAPKEGLFAAYHDVGAQYSPPDSFMQISDAHGPTLYLFRELDNKPTDFIQSVIVSQDEGRMHDSSGVPDYNYDSTYVTFLTRNKWFLGVQSGDAYLRFPGSPGGETNQNGLQVTYNRNSPTPSGISFNFGRFGAGYLHSMDVQGGRHITRLFTLNAEAYQTSDALDNGTRLVQWLDRVSLGYQIGPGESVAVGWRKIIGTGPTFFYAPQFVNATNLSLAYYRRWHDAELYFAYGDPNQLYTKHDMILKLIRYIGADKGT